MHYIDEVSKKYYAVLNDNDSVAVIYSASGIAKASFHVEIKDGCVYLFDDMNHSLMNIETPHKAVSFSRFFYDEEERTLSLMITMHNSETITFSSTLKNIMERDSDKDFDFCHKKPVIDDYVTKNELQEEVKRRRRGDEKILMLIGDISDGSNSLTSQIELLESALYSEVSRAKNRDRIHSEDIDKLNSRFCEFKKGNELELKNLNNKIGNETDDRIRSFETLYNKIEGLKDEQERLNCKLKDLKEKMDANKSASITADKLLDAKIEKEHCDRIHGDDVLLKRIAKVEEVSETIDKRLYKKIDEQVEGLKSEVFEQIEKEVLKQEERDKKIVEHVKLNREEIQTFKKLFEEMKTKIKDLENQLKNK